MKNTEAVIQQVLQERPEPTVALNPLTGLLSLARQALLYGDLVDPAQVALVLVGPLLARICATGFGHR